MKRRVLVTAVVLVVAGACTKSAAPPTPSVPVAPTNATALAPVVVDPIVGKWKADVGTSDKGGLQTISFAEDGTFIFKAAAGSGISAGDGTWKPADGGYALRSRLTIESENISDDVNMTATVAGDSLTLVVDESGHEGTFTRA